MATVEFVPNWVVNLCTDADRRELPRRDPNLLRRIRLLAEADQQLLHLSLSGVHSLRQLARIRGVHPGNLARHLAKLTLRLRNPVVVALADHAEDLPEHYYRIGVARFALGRSVEALVRQFDLDREHIRAILGYLLAWGRLRTAPKPARED